MTRSDPSATYDDDFYAWTQAQAAALRLIPKQALGSRIDIEHIAEEIEDLGKRDLREVESFLRLLFEPLLKIDALPDSRDRTHWFSETLHFQDSALAAFTPSMRQVIDVLRAWDRAQKLTGATLSDRGQKTISIPCPFLLDDLLTSDFDINDALARIAAAKSEA